MNKALYTPTHEWDWSGERDYTQQGKKSEKKKNGKAFGFYFNFFLSLLLRLL